MATVKGQNLRVLVGSSTSNLKCIAAAQSCTLRVDAVAESTGSKDVANDWDTKEITRIDWEVTVEALVTLGTDATGTQLADLTMGQTYTLRLSQTNGTQNRAQVTNARQMTGKAILTDLQIQAQNEQECTYTAKFIGDGELKPYTPST